MIRATVIAFALLLTTTPALAAPPKTVVAERAAGAIERMSRYEGSAIGFAGTPGRTWIALQKILALGTGATPLLERLSSSTNPVARIAGAVGFGIERSREGQATLRRLSNDHELAETFMGCLVGKQKVSFFAKRSLARSTRK